MTHHPARRAALVACTAVLAVVSLAACGDSEPEAEAEEQPTVTEAPKTTDAPEKEEDVPTTTENHRDENTRTVEPDTTEAPDETAAPTTVTPPAQPPARVPPPPTAQDDGDPDALERQAYDEMVDEWAEDLIPAGTIEDGMHYGFITDWEGYEFGFHRVEVDDGGAWTNSNPKERTLPFHWNLAMPPAIPWPIEVLVMDQHVARVTLLPADVGQVDPELGRPTSEPAGMGTCAPEGAIHPSDPSGLIVCIDGIWQWSS
jgi:hypothetical protein